MDLCFVFSFCVTAQDYKNLKKYCMNFLFLLSNVGSRRHEPLLISPLPQRQGMDTAFSAAPDFCQKILGVLFLTVGQPWILAYTIQSLLYSSDFRSRNKTIKGSVVVDVQNNAPIAKCRGRRWRNMTPLSTCDRRGTELGKVALFRCRRC